MSINPLNGPGGIEKSRGFNLWIFNFAFIIKVSFYSHIDINASFLKYPEIITIRLFGLFETLFHNREFLKHGLEKL